MRSLLFCVFTMLVTILLTLAVDAQNYPPSPSIFNKVGICVKDAETKVTSDAARDLLRFTKTDLNQLNEIIQVHDGDSILIAQKLAKQLGLAVGISSGANILGAIKTQNRSGILSCVVTIIADSNKKYLSTDLVKEEPVKPGYLSPEIELVDYIPMKRAYEG